MKVVWRLHDLNLFYIVLHNFSFTEYLYENHIFSYFLRAIFSRHYEVLCVSNAPLKYHYFRDIRKNFLMLVSGLANLWISNYLLNIHCYSTDSVYLFRVLWELFFLVGVMSNEGNELKFIQCVFVERINKMNQWSIANSWHCSCQS